MSIRGYTTRVMSRECKVVQCDDMFKANLLNTGLKRTLKVNNIYSEIYCERNLKIGYEEIRGENGTLDSYSKDTIKSVSNSLKDHTFK